MRAPMISRYTTNVAAHRPLMQLLDGMLLTPKEVGAHLRYSQEQLSNLRRGTKGPPWFKLPSGGVRYDLAELTAWQLSGARGPLTMDRIALAIASCAAVPIEHRAEIVRHLEQALTPDP
jgi:hypothetical protein